MRLRLTSLLSLLLLLPAGCATTLPPPRESPDLSVIGASVSIESLWGQTRAEYAYFVRLDDEVSPLLVEPIRSNFERDGYVYLFNARPGRYAVVSAGYFVEAQGGPAMTSVGGGFSVGTSVGMQNTVNLYLPKTLVEKTVISVGSSEWVFIGDIVLDRAEWEAADELQRHYYGVLAPGHEDMNVIQKAFGGRHDAGAEKMLDQSEAGLARFMTTSLKVVGDDWASAVQSTVAAGPLRLPQAR